MNFSKHTIKKDSNVRIAYSIFTLLIIFLFGIILPKSTKAYSEGNYLNYFYVKAIDNTLSVIKSTSVEQSDNNENSIKLRTLSFLGIDILNPISIITKEIAYLNKNDVSTEVNEEKDSNEVNNLKTFILNPFNLGDKQISKVEAIAEKSNVVATLYNPALKKTLNNAKPEVLIYHSHTSEAYRSSDTDTSKISSSSDTTKNVTSVGDVIEAGVRKKLWNCSYT